MDCSFSRANQPYNNDLSMLRRMVKSFELNGHLSCVNCVEWSVDDRFLLSGSDDTTVKLWNIKNTLEFAKFRKQREKSPESPNQTSDSHKNPENLGEITLKGHNSNVFTVSFLPRNTLAKVVSGSNDADLRVFDVETEKCLYLFKQFSRKICKVDPEPDSENTFLACSADGTVRHFDLRDHSKNKNASDLFDQNGLDSLIIPQAFGGGPFVKRNKSFKNLLLDFKCDVLTFEHHPLNPNIFLVCLKRGESLCYDKRFLTEDFRNCVLNVYSRKNRDIMFPTSACYSPTGEEVLMSYTGSEMYLFNAETFSEQNERHVSLKSLTTDETKKRNELLEKKLKSSCIESNNGTNFSNFNVTAKAPIKTYKGHTHMATIKQASFYGDHFVMTGSDNGKIYVYDKESQCLAIVLEAGQTIVNYARRSNRPFSPEIATGGLGKTVTIWRPELPFEEIPDLKRKLESDYGIVN